MQHVSELNNILKNEFVDNVLNVFVKNNGDFENDVVLCETIEMIQDSRILDYDNTNFNIKMLNEQVEERFHTLTNGVMNDEFSIIFKQLNELNKRFD